MTTPDVTTPTGFADLGVPERIDKGLASAGFAAPFAIQKEAIPVAMAGEDVCGRARTGSGKTLAFGVPMMARIDAPAASGKPHGLVLVPTRELALQVSEVLGPIGKACGVRVLAVYGGADRHKQVTQIDKGAEIIVATPLRLIDLLKENELQLDAVEILVLDEADRMADDGFTPQVEWIMRKITAPHQTDRKSTRLNSSHT